MTKQESVRLLRDKGFSPESIAAIRAMPLDKVLYYLSDERDKERAELERIKTEREMLKQLRIKAKALIQAEKDKRIQTEIDIQHEIDSKEAERIRIKEENQAKLESAKKEMMRLRRKKYEESKRDNDINFVLNTKLKRFTQNTINTITANEVKTRFGLSPCCYITGQPIDYTKGDTYHLDHLIPRSRGGPCTIDNMGLTCPKANLAKGAMFFDELLDLCRMIAKRFPQNEGLS